MLRSFLKLFGLQRRDDNILLRLIIGGPSTLWDGESFEEVSNVAIAAIIARLGCHHNAETISSEHEVGKSRRRDFHARAGPADKRRRGCRALA